MVAIHRDAAGVDWEHWWCTRCGERIQCDECGEPWTNTHREHSMIDDGTVPAVATATEGVAGWPELPRELPNKLTELGIQAFAAMAATELRGLVHGPLYVRGFVVADATGQQVVSRWLWSPESQDYIEVPTPADTGKLDRIANAIAHVVGRLPLAADLSDQALRSLWASAARAALAANYAREAPSWLARELGLGPAHGSVGRLLLNQHESADDTLDQAEAQAAAMTEAGAIRSTRGDPAAPDGFATPTECEFCHGPFDYGDDQHGASSAGGPYEVADPRDPDRPHLLVHLDCRPAGWVVVDPAVTAPVRFIDGVTAQAGEKLIDEARALVAEAKKRVADGVHRSAAARAAAIRMLAAVLVDPTEATSIVDGFQ